MKGLGKFIWESLNWVIGGRLEFVEWEFGEEYVVEDIERVKFWDGERIRVFWELIKELWLGLVVRRERE